MIAMWQCPSSRKEGMTCHEIEIVSELSDCVCRHFLVVVTQQTAPDSQHNNSGGCEYL